MSSQAFPKTFDQSFNNQSYKFFLESLPTPIYRRISDAYKTALKKRGHSVFEFDWTGFSNLETALALIMGIINEQSIDYLLIFDNASLCTFFLQESNCFVFEKFNASIIFLHHENLCRRFVDSQNNLASNILEGWHRVRDRSIHFCLERSNCADLKALGFDRVYPLSHASEFTKVEPTEAYAYEVSFVGHVLPGFERISSYINFDHARYPYHFLAANFWARLVALDQELETSSTQFATQQGWKYPDLGFFEQKFIHRANLHSLSSFFRGELIQAIDRSIKVDIIGGDPGYMHGRSDSDVILQENISYHPPTADYSVAQAIYANSKINLNITALQFDTAVINRVIDVGAVGGFILTDWKPDLARLTSVSEEISYRSIVEMNHKIQYYLTHESERQLIADQLHQDVLEHGSYDRLIDGILSQLEKMSQSPIAPIQIELNPVELIRVDLGCGASKPEGFIGVDRYARSGVDVVADLSQRFPFSDSSVDVVRAYDVVEHLVDRLHTMNEIWRVCKPNATVDIFVPSTDGRGAFQDPTHVSFWNLNSFRYYCVEFPGYLELCRGYGFQGAFQLLHLEEIAGDNQVIHVRAVLQAIKSDSFTQAKLQEQYHLKALNFILFPDWNQLEEVLYESLAKILRSLVVHPDRSQMTLLLDGSAFPETEATTLEEYLYSLVLNLLLSEDLDVASSGLEIAALDRLNASDYSALFSHSLCRIPLSHEQIESWIVPYTTELSICPIESLDSFRIPA